MRIVLTSRGRVLRPVWLCWILLLIMGLPRLVAAGLPAGGECSPIPQAVTGLAPAPLHAREGCAVKSIPSRMHGGKPALNAGPLRVGCLQPMP